MTSAAAAPLVPRGLIPGVVILLVGAVFLADSLGMLDAQTGWALWPIAIIVTGIVVRLQPSTANHITGLILLAAGIWLLFNTIGIWSYSFWRTWPGILMLLGGWMLYRTRRLRRLAGGSTGYDEPTTAAEHVGAFVFLTQVSRRTCGQALRSGELSVIGGECLLDASDVAPGSEPLVIDVFALAGRICICVPSDWLVEMRVLPLLARSTAASDPGSGLPIASRGHLIVQGTAILGVVEVIASPPTVPLAATII